MTGWKQAHVSEIERRNGWIPIRDHFGVRAFGTNAWVGKEKGDTVIPEHNELHGRHEELYVVVEGHATFTVAGEDVDAPAGTLMFVRDPDALRRAVAAEPDTMVLTVGARPGEAFQTSFWELAWRESREAFAHYNEKRYAEAAATLREAVGKYPEHAGVHYNLACFAASQEKPTRRSNTSDAVELRPDFREAAKDDSDFDPIRADPRLHSLVAGETDPRAAGT